MSGYVHANWRHDNVIKPLLKLWIIEFKTSIMVWIGQGRSPHTIFRMAYKKSQAVIIFCVISKSVKKIYKKNCENWGLNTLCFIVGGGGTMHNNWSACKRHCAHSLGFSNRTQFSHFPIDRILMKSGWNYLSGPLSRSTIIYLNSLPERNLKHGVIWWQQNKKSK